MTTTLIRDRLTRIKVRAPHRFPRRTVGIYRSLIEPVHPSWDWREPNTVDLTETDRRNDAGWLI